MRKEAFVLMPCRAFIDSNALKKYDAMSVEVGLNALSGIY